MGGTYYSMSYSINRNIQSRDIQLSGIHCTELKHMLTLCCLQTDGVAVIAVTRVVTGLDPSVVQAVEVETIYRANRLTAHVYHLLMQSWYSSLQELINQGLLSHKKTRMGLS